MEIKKVKNTNKNAIEKVNNLGLQPEMAMGAKKQIPKILSFDEAMGLLSQYGYRVSYSKMCLFIVTYSIPFKRVDGMLSINRNKFMKWFSFKSLLVPTLEQQLLRSDLKECLQSKRKK